MSGILNETGAVSGILGTTVGTPAATNAADVGSGVLPVGVTGGSGLDLTPLSHRNLIINGGMTVWQRETSATAAGGGIETVDRFKTGLNGSIAFTSERHAMSLAELNTTGHSYAVKLDCTTASGSPSSSHYAFYRQPIEAQNLQNLQYGTANAKTITLSFWVKSNKTGIYCIELDKQDSTRYVYVREYTISSADTWEQKTITITPTAGSTSLITGAGGVIVNDTGTGLELAFGLQWGSTYNGATNDTWALESSNGYATSNQVNWGDSTSNDFYITGVQLEVGSVATPFEHRSYADEYIRCMRYFENDNVSAHAIWAHPISNGDDGYRRATMHFKVTKRAVPTVTAAGGSPTGNQDIGVRNFTVYYDGADVGHYKQVQTWTAAAEL